MSDFSQVTAKFFLEIQEPTLGRSFLTAPKLMAEINTGTLTYHDGDIVDARKFGE